MKTIYGGACRLIHKWNPKSNAKLILFFSTFAETEQGQQCKFAVAFDASID